MSVRRVLVLGLVLAAALALTFYRPGAPKPVVDLTADEQACARNLREIYGGLLLHMGKGTRPLQGSGVGLFAALISSGEWPDDAAHAAKLTCPGPYAEPVPAGTDYAALAALTVHSSAYTGRDLAAHPLAKFPCGGDEALVACDGARGCNHDGRINVLMCDGSIRTLELEQLLRTGALPAGTTSIPLGPDSPIPWLRVVPP